MGRVSVVNHVLKQGNKGEKNKGTREEQNNGRGNRETKEQGTTEQGRKETKEQKNKVHST